MDHRLEAVVGLVGGVMLFMPVFAVIVAAVVTKERAARERRIAEYRKSPESRLLLLNDPARS